jgi:hypothetical protein
LIDVCADKSSDDLFSHVQNIVSKFNLESKLVAETCDGASVVNGHLNDLQHKVLEAYSNALHMHCYAHVLNFVLSYSSVFFNRVATFTSYGTKRTEYLMKKVPHRIFILQ